MQRLKWALVGVAVTCFSADYLRLKAERREMESQVLRFELTTLKAQAVSTECLVDLAYNRSLIESATERSRIITTAKVEALNTIEKARQGDAEAITALKDLGYQLDYNKKISAMKTYMGGP